MTGDGDDQRRTPMRSFLVPHSVQTERVATVGERWQKPYTKRQSGRGVCGARWLPSVPSFHHPASPTPGTATGRRASSTPGPLSRQEIAATSGVNQPASLPALDEYLQVPRNETVRGRGVDDLTPEVDVIAVGFRGERHRLRSGPIVRGKGQFARAGGEES